MSPQQPRPAKVIFLLLLLTTIAVHAKAKAGSLTCTWKDNSTNEDGFLIERERQKKGKQSLLKWLQSEQTSTLIWIRVSKVKPLTAIEYAHLTNSDRQRTRTKPMVPTNLLLTLGRMQSIQ